jgi:hypothetical protein
MMKQTPRSLCHLVLLHVFYLLFTFAVYSYRERYLKSRRSLSSLHGEGSPKFQRATSLCHFLLFTFTLHLQICERSDGKSGSRVIVGLGENFVVAVLMSAAASYVSRNNTHIRTHTHTHAHRLKMATSGNPVRTHESPPEGYDSKESAGEVAQSERAGGVQLVDGPEVQLSERETLEDAAESERGAPQQPEPADSGIEIAQVDVTDLPGLDNIDVDRYVGLARRIPQDGLIPLIEAGLEDEITAKSPIGVHGHDKGLKHMWATACSMFFCQMDEELLIAAVAGNVQKAYRDSVRDGTDLARYVDRLNMRAADHPSCYVRTLTDEDGNSPTIGEMNDLVRIIDGYSWQNREDDEFHYQMDLQLSAARGESWTLGETKKGKRFALAADGHEVSPERVKQLEKWVLACNRRIDRCTSTTMEPPMQYVGYAVNLDPQKAQHGGSSTSWFTELVQAACKVLFGTKYGFHMLSICLVPNEQLGPWAEVVLSRFLRAYATDGGFSIAWAGISTKRLGLSNHSKAERQAFWQDTKTWIEANTPVDQNAKTELSRRKAYYQGVLMRRKLSSWQRSTS